MRNSALVSKAAIYVALALLAIPAILPLLWMVSTSFKGNAQIFGGGELTVSSLFPKPLVTKNYPDAMQNMPCLVSAQYLGAVHWHRRWSRCEQRARGLWIR
jgi:ABC-type glycerol-3-phosphate transport system permease component